MVFGLADWAGVSHYLHALNLASTILVSGHPIVVRVSRQLYLLGPLCPVWNYRLMLR